MKCFNCGYEHLDVHNTETAYITYCQGCGTTVESQRAHPRRLAEIRKLPVKTSRNSNQVIQLPEKRARRR